MLENDGVATLDLVEKAYPNDERIKKGAFAVIECFQSIPCNPCFSSCPKGAIAMQDISDLPRLDFDKCTGCGLCVSVCPGLAIFVIDETYSATETLIRMPHEFLPLPSIGDEVEGLSRDGTFVCNAIVRNVLNSKSTNRTPQIAISVKKEFSRLVRCLKIKDENNSAKTESKPNCETSCNNQKTSNEAKACGCVPLGKANSSTPDDAYVCRCEEITLGEIRSLIAKGYTTLDEIKRVSRAGMGACQGRTCRQIIMNEIAASTGVKAEAQSITTFRPTSAPIRMGLLTREDSDNE